MSEASSEGAEPDDGVARGADDGASETTDLVSGTDDPDEYRWKQEAFVGKGARAGVEDMRFTFQRRYAKLNWRTISRTSLERIVERIDTHSLEQMLEPLAFARLRLGDVSSVPEEWLLKLLRLYQLCLEYLMNCKAHLLQQLSYAAAEASEKGDAAVSLRTRCARLRAELKAAQRDSAQRSKALDAYSKMLRVHGDKNAFGPAAAQFLPAAAHADAAAAGSSRRSGRANRKPVVVVLDSRSGERRGGDGATADHDLLARAKVAEEEVAALQAQLSKGGPAAPPVALQSRVDAMQKMWDQERQHWEEERQQLAEKLNEHQLAADTASAEARRLQALADEMAVQRQRAEEAEGQLTQERRSFVEKRQVWQAEREAMEREHEETKRALQRMEAAAEERFAERRSRALGHVVAVGGTATLRRAFAHWRVDVAVAGAGDRAYEAGEASQRLSVSQEELLRRQRQQLRRTLLRLRSNNLWRGLRQWQAYLLIADAEEAEARRREFAVQAQSAQASMERAAAEQARREEAREQRRRRVLETTPAEVTDTYVADLVARYTAARDEGEVGEEDKEAMGVVDRRVSAVVGAQLSVAEQQGRPLVARSCAPLPGRPFVSAFHSHWEADVQARCNDVSEAVEQALEAKGVPADVARQDDDGALLAALVVDQRESLAAPVHQRMRGVESFLHRQLYPEGAEGETGAKGAEEEGSTTASGAKLPRKEVFDLATEVGCELSGRMPPERPPSQLLRRAMEPVRSRAALRVTRFGTLACGDEPSDGEEDEDSADRLRASRDPSYALVRAATSVLLDTEDPRAADARLTTSSDLVRAALVAEARAAAGDRRGGGRGRGVQAQGLEEYDNVLRASREAGRTLLGGQSSEEEGRRKSRLSGRSQHAARRTPWGQRASVTRPRGGAQGWESRAWRQSGSHGRARDDSTSGGVDETGGSDEGEEDDDDEDEESSEEEGDEGEPGAEAGSRSAARRRPGTREGQAGQVPGRKAEHGAEAASPPRERPRARRLDGVGDRSSARGRGAKAGSDPPVPSWSQSPTREPVASRPATSAAQAPPPPSPSSALSASADETPVPFDTRRAQRNRASDAAPAPSATQSRSLPTQEASASASASASSSSSSQAPAPAGAPESASGRRARAAGTASISTGLSTASAIVSTSDSSPPHAPAAKPSPAAALVAADSPSSAGQASSSRDAEWGRRVRPGSSDRGGATFDAPSEEERDEEQQEEDVGDSWATARPMAASVAASRRAEVASDDVQSTAPVSADPESPSTHSWDDESTMSVSARHQPAERQGGPSAGGGRAAPAAGGAAAAEAPAPGDQAATPSRGRVASSWARAFSTQHDSTDEEESVLSSPGQRAAPAPAALGQAGAGVEGGTTEVAHFVPSPDSSPSRGAPSPEHRGRDLTHAALPPPTVAAPSAAGRERATGGVAVRRPGSAALRDFDDDFDEDDSLEVETL